MNYKPYVAGNQSNGSTARVETVPDKDYILLPLWTQDPLFFSSSKDCPGDGFKPSRKEEKKDTKDSTVNATSNEINVVGRKSSIELPDDLNMPDLEDISILEESNEDVFGAEAHLNNMETTFQVSPIPTTRIHKDHPFKQIIRDIHSAPQTRRMTKSMTDHGIDNDIYSTVDACLNACEMWKAIERLKQGESINVQDLETNLY
nr:hypothetical protein [Tanacetum cinerariifolium]